MNDDLISREALRKDIEHLYSVYAENPEWFYTDVLDHIDNAPTVEYPFYQEAYQTGYEEGKNERPHSVLIKPIANIKVEITEEEKQRIIDLLRKEQPKFVKLESERPHGKWIPVSERLPDLWEVVLVTDENSIVFEYEMRPLDEEGNVCEEWSFLGRKIIAWMPLPDPYKEGEEK